MAPPWQAVVPPAQAPGRPVLHGCPPPGLPLSTLPSQSLSWPSQISGEQTCAEQMLPMHEPLLQSLPETQTLPFAQLGHAAPPQSTSVSLPSLILLEQPGGGV